MALLPPPPSAPPGDLTSANPDDGEGDRKKKRDTKLQFVERLRQGRPEVLRAQFENCLFYIGLQWLAPLPDGRGFMRANLRRDVPRPVTNRFKAILDAIDAPLSVLEPSLACVPGSDKDDDRMTADLANRVLDYLGTLLELPRFKGELSKILVTCNNAYAHLGIDPSLGATIRVPKWACPTDGSIYTAIEADEAHGMCPQDGTLLRPSTDEADTHTEGGMFLEAVTPFETWVDYAVQRQQDQPMVMIRRLRPRAWAEAHWPEFAKEIKNLPACSSTSDIGLTFLQSLIRLAPGGSPTAGGIGFGAPVRWQESILDDLLYVKPCTDYPEGLYLRMLGDELIVDDLPLGQIANEGTPDEPGAPFIPVYHYGYDNVPGTHVCTGPADHLKDLQRQRNRREAAIELYFQRSANGIWLIPEGTDVQTPSGEEGTVLRYSPLGSGGAKPERMEGSRLPSSFVEWLQFTDKQMEDIAGTYDLFRGERPPNVSSGYAMQILTERAQARFAHVYANYEVSHAALGKGMFLMFRNHAPEEIYFKIKGEEARWTVLAIRRADLTGGIDIRVEAGSARPRTPLEKKAAVEQALTIPGLIDLTDPTVRQQLLNLYGIPEMAAKTKAVEEQIAREHATLIEWARSLTNPETGEPDPNLTPEEMMLPVLVDDLLDDHPLHLLRHNTFMLTPEFLQLPDWVRQAFRDGHYIQHLYDQQMDQMQAAMSPAPPVINPGGEQPPAGGPPGGGGGGGQNAGTARAMGQAAAMQNGGGVPGGAAERGAQMGQATGAV